MLAAAAAHLGFQLTVTAVVYPALAVVDREHWKSAHDAHGRAITPIVGVTYGALLMACAWSIVREPSSVGVWIALVGLP